jgi:hypothetical protein
MTLIILASLLLSPQAQTSEGPKLTNHRESVAYVLSLLQSPDLNQKGEALVIVSEKPTLRQDARVREAVLIQLRKAGDAYVERHRSSEPKPDHQAGELLLALIRTATKFDGPEVVAALLPYLGLSAIAQRRVASAGSGAVGDLVKRYESGEGVTDAESNRFGALKTLAEITANNKLSPNEQASVERVAGDALKSQETFVYAGGIYLGAATRRPDLVDAAVKARAGQFGNRRLADNHQRFLKSVGESALTQAGVAVR